MLLLVDTAAFAVLGCLDAALLARTDGAVAAGARFALLDARLLVLEPAFLTDAAVTLFYR